MNDEIMQDFCETAKKHSVFGKASLGSGTHTLLSQTCVENHTPHPTQTRTILHTRWYGFHVRIVSTVLHVSQPMRNGDAN
jgi:hypothetical protein